MILVLSHMSLPNLLKPVAFAQSIEVENEDVVGAASPGDAPTTSEWSTSLLPTNTPVTQDGDLATICKIGQIAAGSLWDLTERRGNAADRSEVPKVTAKFWTCSKQAQWGRCGNRSP